MTNFEYEIDEKLKYRGRVATVLSRWWDGQELRYEVWMGRDYWSVSEKSLRRENDYQKVRLKSVRKERCNSKGGNEAASGIEVE